MKLWLFFCGLVALTLLISACSNDDPTAAPVPMPTLIPPTATQVFFELAQRHFRNGLAFKEEGKFDDAVTQFGEALRLDPFHAEAYNHRGDGVHLITHFVLWDRI